MKVRNIVRKAVTLGSGAALVGSTLMGALAYDLADYPDNFVVDGMFDGKIVVGERAATADVLGAIDISASLQAASITEETVEIPGVAGEVSLEGDAFEIDAGSDMLEIREPLGDVYDTLTVSELEALEGGQITTDEGSTDYYQYLRFGGTTANTALQDVAVNYVEDEDDVLGDFLVIDDNAPFFEWEIEFTEGIESEDDATNNLEDLEDEVFNIFGTEFTIVDTTLDAGRVDLTLEFMAGDISDTLREGETRVYSIDGVDYEVTLVFVSDPSAGGTSATNEAKFSVNGELTDSMRDGDTDVLSGGLEIGVRDLLVNSREGVVSFFLGASKITFRDTITQDALFYSGVEITEENIEDAEVSIRGNNVSSTSYEITNIKYRLTADASVGSTIYVPPGMGVREFLDEPEGLLSPTFDVMYQGLTTPEVYPVEIDSQSDHSYEFTATNIRGKTYSGVPLLTAKETGKWGDDDDDFWFTEPNVAGVAGYSSILLNATDTHFFIGDDDYFVLSENDIANADEKDDSSILRYEDIDTSERILSFSDMSTGETREVSYTTTTGGRIGNEIIGVAENLVVEGNSYTVWVGNASMNSLAYPLMIDLDGDTALDGIQVGFTVKGGATVNFDNTGGGITPASSQSANSNRTTTSVNMSIAVPGEQFDDSSRTPSGEFFNWTISVNTGTDVVDVTSASAGYVGPLATSGNTWSAFNLVNDDSDDDYDRGMTDYGILIESYDPTGTNDAGELTLHVPSQQRRAQVFVTAGTVEASAGGAGSIKADKVNPLAVGIAVLDRDAPALGDENLIIIGGPCANTVAADFMDNPTECVEGFEEGKAMIKAEEYGSTVALLVAGYTAQDTQGASRVLASYADYALEGSEVEVVVADLNSITVNAVSEMEEMIEEEVEEEVEEQLEE